MVTEWLERALAREDLPAEVRGAVVHVLAHGQTSDDVTWTLDDVDDYEARHELAPHQIWEMCRTAERAGLIAQAEYLPDTRSVRVKLADA